MIILYIVVIVLIGLGSIFFYKEKKIALHRAIEDGDINRVSKLLAAGCDVNYSNFYSNGTPLRLLIFHPNLAITKMLLDKGANVYATFCGSTLQEAEIKLNDEMALLSAERIPFLVERKSNHIKLLKDYIEMLRVYAAKGPTRRTDESKSIKSNEIISDQFIIEIKNYPEYFNKLMKKLNTGNSGIIFSKHKVYCTKCNGQFTPEALQQLCMMNMFSDSPSKIQVLGATQKGSDFRSGKCPFCGNSKMAIIES